MDDTMRSIAQAYVMKIHTHVLTTCLGAGITQSRDIKAIKRAIGRLLISSSEIRRGDDERDELFDVRQYHVVGQEIKNTVPVPHDDGEEED